MDATDTRCRAMQAGYRCVKPAGHDEPDEFGGIDAHTSHEDFSRGGLCVGTTRSRQGQPVSVTDRDAAARFGVDPPRDHDHGPRYDGEAALWPPAAMDMDRARMEADGWGPCEGLAMPQVHDAGGWGRNRFWARCPRFSCGRLFEGRSEASVERKMREHLGTLR